ncbi:MAG: hypothetical protein HZB51_33140 [Chloroflexi bacterium]|nr:hypothetical protein [Chloroflexota bacterium]
MEPPNPIQAAMEKMLTVCQAQYGNAIKTYWFYAEEICPCCTKRQTLLFKHKNENAVSLNAFMYRERGVLIGYTLCGLCISELLKTSKKRQTLMHENIEMNLIAAYQKHMSHLN